MKRVAPSAGFTIVETMIVLAVTALLFLAVVASWGGKQKVSEYQTALRDVRSQLQQTASDVQNGYFPTVTSTCTNYSGTALHFSTVSGQQGSNGDCLFLGKAIRFKNLSGGIETIKKYSIAGAANVASTNIHDSLPTLAYGMTETLPLASDLETVKIYANGSSSYNGIAFMSDAGSYNGTALLSGRQAIHAYVLRGSLGSLFYDPGSGVGYPLNRVAPTPDLYQAVDNNGIKLCFKSGATDNYALIIIGANGSATNVQAQTTKTTNCGIV